MTLAPDTYTEVPREEKLRLFQEVTADMRYQDYQHGCYECGICVAVCPSARFYDFSPRKITQALAREDVELVYEQMNDDVWNCSQCFSCNKCPRGNSPGGLITVMREVAVRNGLASAREALKGYSRIIYKIMSTGTQVSADMLQVDAFPDWGHEVKDISENMEFWRKALPQEVLRTTSMSWKVAEKTLVELYRIWMMTGVMDMIFEIDEGLHMILTDLMEERIEDYEASHADS